MVIAFYLTINCPTCSGKTRLLLKFLNEITKESLGSLFFFVLHIITTTPIKIGNAAKIQTFFRQNATRPHVEQWLKWITSISFRTNALIILDDVARSQAFKNRVLELVRLAFSARRYKLSVVVLTQQLTSIAKPFRKNAARLISFDAPDETDMQTLMSEGLAVISKDEKNEIIQKLKNNCHSYIEINRRYPFDHQVITPEI